MREAIIDEQKAVPDYEKLIRQFESLEPTDLTLVMRIFDIIKDEKKHKGVLEYYFDKVCPRMAVHREGIEASSGIVVSGRRRITRPRHHRRAMEGYGR